MGNTCASHAMRNIPEDGKDTTKRKRHLRDIVYTDFNISFSEFDRYLSKMLTDMPVLYSLQ